MEFLLVDESDVDRKGFFFFSGECLSYSLLSHVNLHMVMTNATYHLPDSALCSACQKKHLTSLNSGGHAYS